MFNLIGKSDEFINSKVLSRGVGGDNLMVTQYDFRSTKLSLI